MATVKYSELASTDLYEHVEYIAQDKPSAAYRWLESIESTCELLASNPELGNRKLEILELKLCTSKMNTACAVLIAPRPKNDVFEVGRNVANFKMAFEVRWKTLFAPTA